MADPSATDRAAASTRTVELVVAALIFIFGVIVLVDSVRLGWGWAADGPQAGYFPFYIGLLICASGGVVFVGGLRATRLAFEPFVMRGQLSLILKLLIPSIAYAVLIGGVELGPIQWGGVGIYVASTLFIAYFMMRIGGYSALKTAPVALGVSVFFFIVFERWFNVPLPKGPLEALLGLN